MEEDVAVLEKAILFDDVAVVVLWDSSMKGVGMVRWIVGICGKVVVGLLLLLVFLLSRSFLR